MGTPLRNRFLHVREDPKKRPRVGSGTQMADIISVNTPLKIKISKSGLRQV